MSYVYAQFSPPRYVLRELLFDVMSRMKYVNLMETNQAVSIVRCE